MFKKFLIATFLFIFLATFGYHSLLAYKLKISKEALFETFVSLNQKQCRAFTEETVAMLRKPIVSRYIASTNPENDRAFWQKNSNTVTYINRAKLLQYWKDEFQKKNNFTELDLNDRVRILDLRYSDEQNELVIHYALRVNEYQIDSWDTLTLDPTALNPVPIVASNITTYSEPIRLENTKNCYQIIRDFKPEEHGLVFDPSIDAEADSMTVDARTHYLSRPYYPKKRVARLNLFDGSVISDGEDKRVVDYFGGAGPYVYDPHLKICKQNYSRSFYANDVIVSKKTLVECEKSNKVDKNISNYKELCIQQAGDEKMAFLRVNNCLWDFAIAKRSVEVCKEMSSPYKPFTIIDDCIEDVEQLGDI